MNILESFFKVQMHFGTIKKGIFKTRNFTDSRNNKEK